MASRSGVSAILNAIIDFENRESVNLFQNRVFTLCRRSAISEPAERRLGAGLQASGSPSFGYGSALLGAAPACDFYEQTDDLIIRQS